MLSCSIWFSAPSFWMGGGLESRCVGRVCGADGARQDKDGTARKLSANLYDIPLLCARWKTPDDGQRNCPKHVFYSKNKFEDLVHLVGLIIRIYHDAWSRER